VLVSSVGDIEVDLPQGVNRPAGSPSGSVAHCVSLTKRGRPTAQVHPRGCLIGYMALVATVPQPSTWSCLAAAAADDGQGAKQADSSVGIPQSMQSE